ncbi:hypothetical protein AOL_s00076g65 [Orbilia oligospora ATCC 24927]|uniref:SHSP domain-containing protein n=2 Tax=Orbilia oligospora TaxID=2813651 RepID=G1X8V8_ARTOA|nr:hypothetical protein AOL_s00076g65 [Orbilia oligospora ATCC 24927]EGX50301.1 hypothetical protein AOL_s00076g65 [Orbilia oligospora ATCC 24927]KAF3278532.1 hypothetical protein TWF970_004539 [Orbilia oligospora]
MPFVRFQPVSFQAPAADPFVDFLAAALAAENTPSRCHPKPNKSAACAPAQCQTRSCAPRQTRVVKRFITPKFDVSETADAYVLEGELPGVSNKASISVDFDDAQTIVVKGEINRVKRPFTKTEEHQELTEEALQASAAAQETATANVTTADGETVVYDDAASVSSGNSKPKAATVEDEVDESETASNASFEVVDGPLLTKADKGKAPTKDADVEMTEAAEKPAEPATEKKEKKQEKTAKYWISERPIGVFERKFKFEGLIDQDNVRAFLENGLLTIVIPKREAFIRSVFIN